MLRRGRFLPTLRGHFWEVEAVAFSLDTQNCRQRSKQHDSLLGLEKTHKKIEIRQAKERLMKRMTFLILSVLFGTLILSPNIFAQSNATVRISSTSAQSLRVGETLTFPLTITAGENVAGYQATVSYDTSALPLCLKSERGLPASGSVFCATGC